jgi:hypothetical protein
MTGTYQRMSIAGIEMDVKKYETLYLARSPRWKGFLISARTLEQLESKLPEAMREYEQFVGEGERDVEVRKAFAVLLAEQGKLAHENVEANLDPERVLTFQAIRGLCATLWPLDFADEREMALFKAKWAEDDRRIAKEMGDGE